MSESRASTYVREFHEKFKVPILNAPKAPSPERIALREDLIREEFDELLEAGANRDPVAVADALADLVYVIYGAAHEWGIPLDAVLREVHRSNMTKVWDDGTVHYREDGKMLKPPTYSRANIAEVLGV